MGGSLVQGEKREPRSIFFDFGERGSIRSKGYKGKGMDGVHWVLGGSNRFIQEYSSWEWGVGG